MRTIIFILALTLLGGVSYAKWCSTSCMTLPGGKIICNTICQ